MPSRRTPGRGRTRLASRSRSGRRDASTFAASPSPAAGAPRRTPPAAARRRVLGSLAHGAPYEEETAGDDERQARARENALPADARPRRRRRHERRAVGGRRRAFDLAQAFDDPCHRRIRAEAQDGSESRECVRLSTLADEGEADMPQERGARRDVDFAAPQAAPDGGEGARARAARQKSATEDACGRRFAAFARTAYRAREQAVVPGRPGAPRAGKDDEQQLGRDLAAPMAAEGRRGRKAGRVVGGARRRLSQHAPRLVQRATCAVRHRSSH